MAKKFTSIFKIEQKYKRIARETLKNKILPKIEEKLKDNINKTVYAKSSNGGWYDRTYAMLNSVRGTVEVDNDIQTIISIFPRPGDMTSLYPSVRFPYNINNQGYIVEWLNEGTNDSPVYNHPKHHFMDMTANESSEIVRAELDKAFRQAGNMK